MCNGYGVQIDATAYGATNYDWNITSGNASNAYLSNFGNGSASFNSYVNDCYGLTIKLSNECGTTTDGLTICVNDCMARYTIYPNPAKDQLIVAFSEAKDKRSLPQRVELIQEESGEVVYLVDLRESFENKKLQEGKQLRLTVADFPRGTYYLKVINNDSPKEKVVIHRVVLN